MSNQLFNTDSFVIGHSLFMSIICSSETIETNSAVEGTAFVIADKLVGFAVLEAVIVGTVHID